MVYKIIADIVVLIHFFWILFLFLGAIWGRKNKFLKVFHISGLFFAFLIQIFDWYCPLTHLEVWLRSKHSPALTYAGSFIIHYVEQIVYIELSRYLVLIFTIFLCGLNGWLYLKKLGKKVPFHCCPHRPECSKMGLRGDPMVEDSEKRGVKDRRKKPTSRWSWFTFLGRRRIFRRISDQEKAGYVDRYSPILFFLMVLILGLNILDSLFTMMILDLGGQEFNPIVRSFIELHGDMFWVWRFVIVSIALILLYLHRGFVKVRRMIITIGLIYIVIVIYQMYLILYH